MCLIKGLIKHIKCLEAERAFKNHVFIYSV